MATGACLVVLKPAGIDPAHVRSNLRKLPPASILREKSLAERLYRVFKEFTMLLIQAHGPSPTVLLPAALRKVSRMRINTQNLHAAIRRLPCICSDRFVFITACYRGVYAIQHPIPVSPSGKALCLLKTQFAKKPKNPV